MKVSEAKAQAAEIRRTRNDPESSHALEDQLLVSFVRDFANGRLSSRTAAQVIAEVVTEQAPRWYA